MNRKSDCFVHWRIFLLYVFLSACGGGGTSSEPPSSGQPIVAFASTTGLSVIYPDGTIGVKYDITAQVNTLTVSPNGRYVAFRMGIRGLAIYDSVTDDTSLIAIWPETNHIGESLKWAPDSSKLAYSKTLSDGTGTSLYVANMETMSSLDIVKASQLTMEHFVPLKLKWSNDSEYIAVTAGNADRTWQLVTIHADGSRFHDLFQVIPGTNLISNYHWTTDSSGVIAQAFLIGDVESELYLINYQASEYQRLTDARSFDYELYSDGYDLEASPNNRYLIYKKIYSDNSAPEGNLTEFLTLDLTTLESHSFIPPSRVTRELEWSESDDIVAYIQDDYLNMQSLLKTYDFRTSDTRIVAQDAYDNIQSANLWFVNEFSWSPLGKMLLYVAWLGNGVVGEKIYDYESEIESILFDPALSVLLSGDYWSPHGSYLPALLTVNDVRKILLIDVLSSQKTELYSQLPGTVGIYLENWEWSRDGRYFFYTIADTSVSQQTQFSLNLYDVVTRGFTAISGSNFNLSNYEHVFLQ